MRRRTKSALAQPLASRPSVRLGLLSLSAAYFIPGTGSLAVIGLLEPMAGEFQVSKANIAELVGVFALTFALAAPALQVVLGAMPRRSLLLLGLALLAMGSLGTALAPSFGWAIAARVVMALGAAAVGPTASALGAGIVPPAEQAKALATVFAGMTIATVLGVPLATWIGHTLSWQAVFTVLAGLAVVIGMGAARFITDRSAGPRVAVRSLAQVLTHAATGRGVAVTLLQMAAQFATYALIAVVLTERFHSPASWVSPALLFFGVGGIAGNVLAARLGDRLGTERLLWASIAGLFLAFVALAAAPASTALATSVMVIWALVAMLFQAPQQKRLIGLAPQWRGLVLAMNASALYLGMSLGTVAGTQAYRAWGLDSLAVLSATITVLAGIAQWLSQRSATAQSANLAQARNATSI
jgi:DHA1 family inner membrane transport protein